MFRFNSLMKAGLVAMLVIAFHLTPIVKSVQSSMTLPSYVIMFVIYAFVALQLYTIKSRIKVRKLESVIIVFSFFFVVDSLMSVFEGNFFIENYQLTHHLAVGLLKSILVVTAVFILWKQEESNHTLKTKAREYLKTRSILSWLVRVVFVLLCSFIVYMIIGAFAYPFTGPYMEATIKIPSLFENFMIQILRGTGYLAVTLPIMMLWDNKKSLWTCLCTSYILFYPILGYSFTHSLPLPLRVMDGIVLSLHLIVFSLLVVKYLRRGVKND